MSWTFIVTKIDDEGEFMSVFGQLIFANNYAAGGDGAGTTVLDKGTAGVLGQTANSASMPVFLTGQTALHASRPPYEWNVAVESGYNPVLVPGNGPLNFKLKFWDPATKAELAAGAYPASLTGAVYNTLLLRFKKAI